MADANGTGLETSPEPEEPSSTPGEPSAPDSGTETVPQANAANGEKVITESLGFLEPAAGGISCAGWTGLGLAAGLLAAAVAVGVFLRLRRRKSRRASSSPSASAADRRSGTVTVEKLHGQGARDGQQDCFFVSPAEETAGLLAVVADGMGGLSDGDKVSQAAVSAMAEGFYHVKGTPREVLLQLAEQANYAVNQLLGDNGIYRSGSTLTAGLLRDGAFHYLSVGDSRICLYRQGVLYQLNREHIFRSELAVRFVNGEETLENVASHPKAGGLTSFLGMGQLKYIDLPAEPIAVRPGDRFILMSDGVYNALTPAELTAALERDQSAEALDEAIRAKAYKNQDNYTAVILNC